MVYQTDSDQKMTGQNLPNLWESEVQEVDLVAHWEEQEAKRAERRKQRLGRFTSSQRHKMMTGADDPGETKEQLVERLTRVKKDELLELCEAANLDADKSLKNAELAEMLVEWSVVKPKPAGVEQWPDGAETHVEERVVEVLTGQPLDEVTTFALQWGNDHEFEAVAHLEILQGEQYEKTGDDQEFIDENHPAFDKDNIPEELWGHIGGTPDGWKDGKPRIEIKCPKSMTHFKYLRKLNSETIKEEYKEVYWQCQDLMYLSGQSEMLMESYDPRFLDEKLRSRVVVIKRNEEDIRKIEKRLLMAVRRKLELIKEVTEG